MKRSSDRILVTHVGSLPRPSSLIDLYREGASDAAIQASLATAVDEVVDRQIDAGIDIVNDGEYGKVTRSAVDTGAWWSYVYDRMAGFEVRENLERSKGFGPARSKDRAVFREFYETGWAMTETNSAGQSASAAARLAHLACTGPVKYTGQALIQRDVENLRAALADTAVEDAFMPAVSPSTLQILANEYYAKPDDYTWALAEAISEEYHAIVDGGFILQIDDPALVDIYDWWFADDLPGFYKWADFQIEALNHALKGIPEDRIRYHVCWGSWHGPHSTDLPLKDIAAKLMTVNAQAFSVEAGNVRHEHEWKVWRDTVKLPEGRILIPGVVSHATNVLEHPELVADRLIQYANIVGRENVIAGTDCGLGGRVHPQIAWAKLRALREGADLASKKLWS